MGYLQCLLHPTNTPCAIGTSNFIIAAFAPTAQGKYVAAIGNATRGNAHAALQNLTALVHDCTITWHDDVMCEMVTSW